MSADYFDHGNFKIAQFADDLEREIKKNNKANEWGYAHNFDEQTIALLCKCREAISLAADLAYQAQLLYSGDIDEKDFVESAGKLLKGPQKGHARVLGVHL